MFDFWRHKESIPSQGREVSDNIFSYPKINDSIADGYRNCVPVLHRLFGHGPTVSRMSFQQSLAFTGPTMFFDGFVYSSRAQCANAPAYSPASPAQVIATPRRHSLSVRPRNELHHAGRTFRCQTRHVQRISSFRRGRRPHQPLSREVSSGRRHRPVNFPGIAPATRCAGAQHELMQTKSSLVIQQPIPLPKSTTDF